MSGDARRIERFLIFVTCPLREEIAASDDNAFACTALEHFVTLSPIHGEVIAANFTVMFRVHRDADVFSARSATITTKAFDMGLIRRAANSGLFVTSSCLATSVVRIETYRAFIFR